MKLEIEKVDMLCLADSPSLNVLN